MSCGAVVHSPPMCCVIRRLSTLCWAASLLLCVVTTFVWAKSYWVSEAWYSAPVAPLPAEAAPLPGRPPSESWCYQYIVAFGLGRVEFAREHLPLVYADGGGGWWRAGWAGGALKRAGSSLPSHGFEYQHTARRRSASSGGLTTLHGLWLVGIPEWRRDRGNLCRSCAYPRDPRPAPAVMT